MFMGVLRLLLAISVAFNHFTGKNVLFVNGAIAVESFYIISGFLMTFILNNQYKEKSWLFFITNRGLRIYPTYWAIAMFYTGIVWSFSLQKDILYTFWNGFSGQFLVKEIYTLYIFFANIFLVGLDGFFFLRLTDIGTLVFTQDFHVYTPWLPITFILVPQAWSLAIELYFYIIAPFFVRRGMKMMIILLLVAMFIKFFVNNILQYNFDPWTNRFFFPCEIVFFLLGVVDYYILCKYKERIKQFKLKPWMMYFILIVYTALFPFIQKDNSSLLIPWLYYIFIFAFIPIAFVKIENKYDKYIGNLSYPIYLIHIVILVLIKKEFPDVNIYRSWRTLYN